MFSLIPTFFIKRRTHLTFFVTNLCNSKCRDCFYYKSINQDKKEISIENITKFAKSWGNMSWLLLSGGEPYLRKDLIKICAIFYKYCKPLVITIPTNGILVNKIVKDTEQIAKICPNSTIIIKLSIDGFKKTHDYIKCVKGSYEKVISCFKCLKSLKKKYRNLEVGFNSVVTKKNQDELMKLYQKMKKFEPDSHTFSLIRGHPKEKKLKDVSYNLFFKILEQVTKQEYMKKGSFFNKLKRLQDILQKKFIKKTILKKKRIHPCYAGKINFVLSENGDLYPCELLNIKIGNLYNFDFNINKMLKNDETKKILKKIYKQRCYCTHECYWLTNILFNIWNYPKLFLLSFKLFKNKK